MYPPIRFNVTSDLPRNARADTETHCHCGAMYHGSDHCPRCECEQYETENVRQCPMRQRRSLELSTADQCQRLVETIAERTGEDWTFGYIGNLERWGDDRCWYAFRPHPGRVGTAADSIGGVGTDDLGTLYTLLRGFVSALYHYPVNH